MTKGYRFHKGSHASDYYAVHDRHPEMIAQTIDNLRWSYRHASKAEKPAIARLGESYQQLHEKHFGRRY